MTNDTDKIVAAILATAYCSKIEGSSESYYLSKYNYFLQQLKEAAKKPPMKITNEVLRKVSTVGNKAVTKRQRF